MEKKPKIVYIDDEIDNLNSFKMILERNYDIDLFVRPKDFFEFLKNHNNIEISVVIADYKMPEMNGSTLLYEVKKILPSTRRVIISAYDDSYMLLDAINKSQIHKYILKPWNKKDLLTILEEQIEIYELTNELNKKYEELYEKNLELIQIKEKLEEENKVLKSYTNLNKMVKSVIIPLNNEVQILILNSVMLQIYDKINKLKDNLNIIFITGEKGVGKKILVKYLLYNIQSIENKENFFTFDCTIYKDRLFNELVNVINKINSKSLIYITNIEELDKNEQKKLLAMLEDKKIILNYNEKIDLNNIIFALSTNKVLDLKSNNQLIDDLIFYLSPYHIHIPPLRQRKDELPLFINYFLKFYSNLNNKQEPILSEKVLKYLIRYNWPGNLDELKNSIYKSVILAENEIHEDYFSLLPNYFDQHFELENISLSVEIPKTIDFNQLEFNIKILDFYNDKILELNYDEILDEFERFVFKIALEKTNNNKTKSAYILGLKTGKFLYKTKYLGL